MLLIDVVVDGFENQFFHRLGFQEDLRGPLDQRLGRGLVLETGGVDAHIEFCATAGGTGGQGFGGRGGRGGW